MNKQKPYHRETYRCVCNITGCQATFRTRTQDFRGSRCGTIYSVETITAAVNTNAAKHGITQCPSCLCMTHTINGKCGKCGADKALLKSVNSAEEFDATVKRL